jgi:dTMP kinase
LRPRSPAPAAATPATEEQTGKNEGRFESEHDEFFRRVWEKYREIAAREPARVVVLIEGDLDMDDAYVKIVEAAAKLLSRVAV